MIDLEVSLPTGLGVATYPPGATFGPRHLRDYEFVWLIEGDAVYERAGQRYDAPQGSLVLCRPTSPDTTDGFVWDAQRRTRHAYFHFSLGQTPRVWLSPALWPLVRADEADGPLTHQFRYVLAWGRGGDPLTCRLAIAGMVAAWATDQTRAVDVPPDALPDAVERALAFMRATLDADPAASISLRQLAEAGCVSPEHLCRNFKSSTGRTPLETLRLARLDRAAVLLARSNYGVAEIARLCGFASEFHFSRRFKEAYGSSPRGLRDRVRGGETPPAPRLTRHRR